MAIQQLLDPGSARKNLRFKTPELLHFAFLSARQQVSVNNYFRIKGFHGLKSFRQQLLKRVVVPKGLERDSES